MSGCRGLALVWALCRLVGLLPVEPTPGREHSVHPGLSRWAIARGLASLVRRVVPLSFRLLAKLVVYIEATRLNFQRKPPRSPPGLAGPHPLRE